MDPTDIDATGNGNENENDDLELHTEGVVGIDYCLCLWYDDIIWWW